VSPHPDDPATLPGWAFGIGLAAVADWLKNKRKENQIYFFSFCLPCSLVGRDRSSQSRQTVQAASSHGHAYDIAR